MIVFTKVRYDRGASGAAGGPREVDFALAPGEYVALAGRTGSGKTTLLRLANGLRLPTAGRVEVDGAHTGDTAGRHLAKQRVGLILGSLEDQLLAGSIEEEVAFGPACLGLPGSEIEERVVASLAALGLHGREGDDPASLEPLDRYRVLIAALLAQGARYLLVDDLAGALGADERAELAGWLARLRRERGLGVLLAGVRRRDLAWADRVVALAEGRVIFDGPPRALELDPVALVQAGLEAAGPGADDDALEAGSGEPTPRLVLPEGARVGARGAPSERGTPAAWPGRVVGLLVAASDLLNAAMLLGGLGPSENVAGIELAGRPARREELRRSVAVAMAGEDSQLLGGTVREEMAHGRRLGTGAATEALEVVGLPAAEYGDRAIATLSSGERARLAIAGGLARRPAVLVLVNALARLDEGGGREMMARVRGWAKRHGSAVLLMTPRRDEVEQVVDELVEWAPGAAPAVAARGSRDDV